MAKIVGVHGISQEFRGSHSIQAEWLPQLKDGLELVGAALDSDQDFRCAFYGDLFRGKAKAVGIPDYNENDITTDWEQSLLEQWWAEAATVDKNIPGPNATSKEKVWSPRSVQKALRALSRSKYFGGVAEKIVIYLLKQVSGYLHKPELRRQIRDRVIKCIDEDTRVLVGHSLGSIVCYEALCEHPEWPVEVFVSLGSPLGIPRLIFDQLEPSPENGVGQWPGRVKHWVNIADQGDVVALEKTLAPLFQGDIKDYLINNGLDAHNAGRYLTAEETGAAIQLGLKS